jgi:AcrR family transcriptional regulator
MTTTAGEGTPAGTPLGVERIVEVACRIVERDGLAGLSMRKLGAELGVDPMAVYHHVAGKRELLSLVTARTIGAMSLPDPVGPWEERVRVWAMAYFDVVARHRDLTLAGLADPVIAAGGAPSTDALVAAVTDSGAPADVVEPIAFLVVDAVHGAALSAAVDDAHARRLRETFAVGLDTIIAGIAAQAAPR